MIDFNKELNAEQCAAATAGDGPLLPASRKLAASLGVFGAISLAK